MYQSKEIIKNQFNTVLTNKWATNSSFFIGLSDELYYLPELEEFKKYIYKYPILLNPLDSINGTEGFDCDDFSFALKGNVALFNRNVAKKTHSWAVGIIWGNFDWMREFHACNCIVSSDMGIVLVEPQTSKIYNLSHCTGNVKLVIL